MGLLLREGLLGGSRLPYIRAHPLVWRASWGLWVLTSISLVAFYFLYQRAAGGPRWAAWLALAGLAADLSAETIYIVRYPALEAVDLARHDRLCALLSATLGNGAYTVAWHVLARRGGPPRWAGILAAPGIAAGYLMAAAGIVYWEAGLAISTAVAIPAFVGWALAAGRFCWKKAAERATMSPHV
jgi:hypothetical protein